MYERAYQIVDEINSNLSVKKLEETKQKIIEDKEIKALISRFKKAKEQYERYGLNDEFIKAKRDLLNNEIIKRYLDVQNEINMLSLLINQRLARITKTR